VKYKKDHIEEIDKNTKVCQKKPWTREEEASFHSGFQLYGTNWGMYEALLPRRTATALELYYHRVYKYEKLNGGPSYHKHARLQQKIAAQEKRKIKREEVEDNNDDDWDGEGDNDDDDDDKEDEAVLEKEGIAVAQAASRDVQDDDRKVHGAKAGPSSPASIRQRALQASAMEQATFLQQNAAAAAIAHANAAAAAQQQQQQHAAMAAAAAAAAAAASGTGNLSGLHSQFLNPAIFLQQQQQLLQQQQQQQFPTSLLAQIQLGRQLQLQNQLQGPGAQFLSQTRSHGHLYPGALNPFAQTTVSAPSALGAGLSFPSPTPAGVASAASGPPAASPAAAPVAPSSGASFGGAKQSQDPVTAELLRYYQLYR